jgi:hypothetical protein
MILRNALYVSPEFGLQIKGKVLFPVLCRKDHMHPIAGVCVRHGPSLRALSDPLLAVCSNRRIAAVTMITSFLFGFVANEAVMPNMTPQISDVLEMAGYAIYRVFRPDLKSCDLR